MYGAPPGSPGTNFKIIGGAVVPTCSGTGYTGGSFTDHPGAVAAAPSYALTKAVDHLSQLRTLAAKQQGTIKRLVRERNERGSRLSGDKVRKFDELARDADLVRAQAADALKLFDSGAMEPMFAVGVFGHLVSVHKRLIDLLSESTPAGTPARRLSRDHAGRARVTVRRPLARTREHRSTRSTRTVSSRSAGGGDDGPSPGGGDPPDRPSPLGLKRHHRHGLVNERMGRFLSACCVECGRPLIWHGGELICVNRTCSRWGRAS